MLCDADPRPPVTGTRPMKFRLLTPGPTPVPEETLLELARPVFYHRSGEFRKILREVLADLRVVFCTDSPILPLTSSGTGGLEAALVNAVPPGKKAICLSAKAWKVIDKNPSPRSYYFDLKKARASLETNDTPYTPAHTLIRAMRLSLKKIVAEGMENIWKRQARYAGAARAGFQALGLAI